MWFEAVPGGHDGTSAITFKVKFNKKPADYSYVTLRDSTLKIRQGGQGLTASRARRLNAPHNDQWEVTITPVSTARSTGTISNSDPLPKGWLARFGRTSATQVLGLLDARFDEARAPASQLTLGGRPVNLAALSGHPQGRRDPAAERTAASPHVLNSGQVDPAAGSADPDADPFDVLSSRYTLDDTAWGIADLNSDPAALHADPSAGSDPAAAAVGAGGKATLLERLAWKLLTQDNWSVDRRKFLSRSSFDLPLSALKGETDDEQAPATGPCGAAAR